MPNLAIIPIFDLPGSRRWRVCGKLAVSSLLRALWDGEIRVLGPGEPPLFPTGRRDLVEKVKKDFAYRDEVVRWNREQDVGAGILKDAGPRGAFLRWQVACRAARAMALEEVTALANSGACEWVLLMDADCVALKNPDHLLDRDDADVLVTSTTTPDPGFVAVRGAMARNFAGDWIREWEKREKDWENGYAAALAELLSRDTWRVGVFENGEVVRAGFPGVSIRDVRDAAVIHFGGMEPKDKQRLAFAFHMMAVYGDRDGLFLEMLES